MVRKSSRLTIEPASTCRVSPSDTSRTNAPLTTITNCRAGAGCQPRAIACGVVVIRRKLSTGIEPVDRISGSPNAVGIIVSGRFRSAKCEAPCSSFQTRVMIISGILLSLRCPARPSASVRGRENKLCWCRTQADRFLMGAVLFCGCPRGRKENLRDARTQLGADFCSAFGAAIQCRGPVWEFADRVQI
jgi:hypothetical protein